MIRLKISRFSDSKIACRFALKVQKRLFTDIQIRPPEKQEPNNTENEFRKYKPDEKFTFDKEGFLLFYEHRRFKPIFLYFFIALIFGLVSYQLIYRWYKSNRFLNIFCTIAFVPLAGNVINGIFTLSWTCSRVKISKCGSFLKYKKMLMPFERTVQIKSLRNYEISEIDEKKKIDGNYFVVHTVRFNRLGKIQMFDVDDESVFKIDKDLFRAVMNARECDFSNSF